MPKENFGHFVGVPKTSWSSNNSWMTLIEDYIYVDKNGVKWIAPKGAEIDGASIPKLFWPLIGSPYTGPHRNSAVVHDAQCVLKAKPWWDVHRIFYEGCRCSGVSQALAKTMYYAVYHFGPRWVEGQSIRQSPPPGDLDVFKVYEEMKKKDFSLETIRRM